MNYITLNNGVKIPQIGLGVFRTPDGADTANAVKWAIEAGWHDAVCADPADPDIRIHL